MGEKTVIEFAWPYLFLLIPLPWLVYRYLPASNFNREAALKVPFLGDFTVFKGACSIPCSKFKMVLILLIWFAALAAAARPQWIGKMISLPQTGRDLMLAVDLSGSMQTKDYEINGHLLDRLSAVKVIAADFIDRRKGDRIGLILFGSQAYLQAPLTFDALTVKQLLMEAAVGLAGTETAIGDAIGLAVKQLRDKPQESRVLILITDGNNNAGELSPEKAAEIAAHENLKIHTIAIGSKSQSLHSSFGLISMMPHYEIDEDTLKMVADKTGGQFFRAYNSAELAQIYQHIDQLERQEHAYQHFRPIKELYYWPLALVVFLSGILMCYECMGRWQQ